MSKVALAASLIPIAVLGYLIYQALTSEPQSTTVTDEQQIDRQVLQTEKQPFSDDLNKPDKRLVIYPKKPQEDSQQSASVSTSDSTRNNYNASSENNYSSPSNSAPASSPEPEPQSPPPPVITSGPSGKITNRDPRVSFTGSGELRCSLNQRDFAAARPCGSPQVFVNLADRRYVFRVWSVIGQQRSPAAKKVFTVAAKPPPGARIISGPKKWSNSRSAEFRFRAGQENLNFLCSIDSRALQPCSSPFVVNGLADGWHRFRVQTVNSLGVKSAVIKKRRFNVDTVSPGAPILLSAPAPESTASAAQFTFRSTEGGSRFRCSLTVGVLPQATRLAASQPCRSGVSYQGLDLGTYLFTVIAIDRAGNASIPREYQFTRVVESEPAVSANRRAALRASDSSAWAARSGGNPPIGYHSADQGAGARQSQAITLEIDPAIEVLNVATSNDTVAPQAGGDGGEDDAQFTGNVSLRSNLGWTATATESGDLGLVAPELTITGDGDAGPSNKTAGQSGASIGDGTQGYTVDYDIDISWADDASPENEPYTSAIDHDVSNILQSGS